MNRATSRCQPATWWRSRAALRALALSAAAVELTPIPAGSRILFQGDAITEGKRGRSLDPHRILGHGESGNRAGSRRPLAKRGPRT